MNRNIFIYIQNNGIGKHAKIVTTRKEFEGIIRFIDSSGNIKIDTDSSVILIQRKYIIGVEILNES